MVKYVLVTGGVISGIGKGIVASSTGLLLKSYGFTVTAIKIDPYLNIDAGTLSPIDHGEVFVLDDGGEVDLDLGNYERFLDITLRKENNITTGQIYLEVIEKERRGDYLGKTVQVIPHVTDTIQDWVDRASRRPTDGGQEEPDFCIIELGGTVGDIESAPFVEAMRQFQFRVGPGNFCVIHVSLIPLIGSDEEQKSKPTQSSVRDLRSLGLTPDVIVCRCTNPVESGIREKISMFCHVTPDCILSVHDCSSVYHVPLLLHQQGLLHCLLKRFNVPTTPFFLDSLSAPMQVENDKVQLSSIPNTNQATLPPPLVNWKNLCNRMDHLTGDVHIALVGKYTELKDSYISVTKSLHHAALACERRLIIDWVESGDLEPRSKASSPSGYHEAWRKVSCANGILIPGGFGDRGLDGKLLAIQHARTKNIPFLGICLGLQAAIIEFARNVLHWENANSTEMNPETKHPVVVYMPEISKTRMGGTMRLGKRASVFNPEHARASLTRRLYGNVDIIYERHRHRYEVNPELVSSFEAKGMFFVAQDESKQRMEIIELDRRQHCFFIATQYHPEFQTRPMRPSPIFLGFFLASAGLLDDYMQGNFFPLTEEVMGDKEYMKKRENAMKPSSAKESPKGSLKSSGLSS